VIGVDTNILVRYLTRDDDFSDYLIGAISQQSGCTTTATFDRKLRDDKGFNLLE
jgi:predicted nucleic-acid-binding protein